MRTRNALKNILSSLILQITVMAFGLYMPRMVMLTYGSSVNGLASGINQFLGILALLQAGAVGASIYEMYKPAADEDYYRISLIIGSSARYFKRIGLVFLLLVTLLSPLAGAVYKDSAVSFREVAAAMLILGLSSSNYIFFVSKYDILFSSFQKRYILSVSGLIEKLLYYSLVIFVIKKRLWFMWMYVAALTGSFARVLFLRTVYGFTYKKRMIKVESGDYKIHNRGYLLVSQIAQQVTDSAPAVIVSAVYGLKYGSVYSVYSLVMTTLYMAISTLQLSTGEIFGNLRASGGEERTKRVYNVLHYCFSMLGIFLCSCAVIMFMPFVKLYTRGISDALYILPELALLVVVYIFICSFYAPAAMLSNVCGLFKEVYGQSLACAILGTAAGLALSLSNMPLVLVGPLFFYLTGVLWRDAVLRKKVTWYHEVKVRKRAAASALFITGAFFSRGFFENLAVSWRGWLIAACLAAAAAFTAILIYSLLFDREAMKQCFSYAAALFGTGKKKNRIR